MWPPICLVVVLITRRNNACIRRYSRALVGGNLRRELEFPSHFHQIRHRLRLHLLHHLASMRFYGDFANAKLATDLLIQETEIRTSRLIVGHQSKKLSAAVDVFLRLTLHRQVSCDTNKEG